MTVTLRVYQNGELLNEHMATGKYMKLVDEYLEEHNIPHEKGKEHDDIVEYTKEHHSKIILIDNTSVLGVDGGTASWVSEYWVDYEDSIYYGLIEKLKEKN